jgi:hypothetical protein
VKIIEGKVTHTCSVFGEIDTMVCEIDNDELVWKGGSGPKLKYFKFQTLNHQE